MAITVEATYEHGVIKPKRRLRIAEGSRVQVTITTLEKVADPLAGVVGIGASGRTDGARAHDRHIYKKRRP